MDSIRYLFPKKANQKELATLEQSVSELESAWEQEENNQYVFELPKPHELKTGYVDLRATIEQRTSIRKYSGIPLIN